MESPYERSVISASIVEAVIEAIVALHDGGPLLDVIREQSGEEKLSFSAVRRIGNMVVLDDNKDRSYAVTVETIYDPL